MRNVILAAGLAAMIAPAMPVSADPPPWGSNDRREHSQDRDDRRDMRNDRREPRNDRREAQDYRRYDYNRADPRYGGYYADRYYREGKNYRTRTLGRNDRIYRGKDGRYYCRRDDGTTGLIIGGLAGGVLGNTIAPGGSKLVGTILGGGAGALLGRAIDKNGVKCR